MVVNDAKSEKIKEDHKNRELEEINKLVREPDSDLGFSLPCK